VVGCSFVGLQPCQDHPSLGDEEGRRLPGKLVGLTFGRMAYDTYTDDRGRFEFRPASIKPGPDALKIETVSKPVEMAALATPSVKRAVSSRQTRLRKSQKCSIWSDLTQFQADSAFETLARRLCLFRGLFRSLCYNNPGCKALAAPASGASYAGGNRFCLFIRVRGCDSEPDDDPSGSPPKRSYRRRSANDRSPWGHRTNAEAWHWHIYSQQISLTCTYSYLDKV
jgi:hypothetical protein